MSNVCKRNHHLCHRENRYSWQRIILFIHLWWWSRRKTTREEIFFFWQLMSDLRFHTTSFAFYLLLSQEVFLKEIETLKVINKFSESERRLGNEILKRFSFYLCQIYFPTRQVIMKRNTTLRTKYKQITPTHYNNRQVKNTLHNAQIICR